MAQGRLSGAYWIALYTNDERALVSCNPEIRRVHIDEYEIGEESVQVINLNQLSGATGCGPGISKALIGWS